MTSSLNVDDHACRVLIVVHADPRISERPAEAVRVAAGLASWRRVRVTLCLCGVAALALAITADDLRGAGHFAQHLPLLPEAHADVLVVGGGPWLPGPLEAWVPFSVVEVEQLAALAGAHDDILTF